MGLGVQGFGHSMHKQWMTLSSQVECEQLQTFQMKTMRVLMDT
jgi:hypothetical protein